MSGTPWGLSLGPPVGSQFVIKKVQKKKKKNLK